jgi:hypothetical protein
VSGAPLNGWTAENAPMQVGSSFYSDSIYNRMNTVGVNLWTDDEDTVIDLHIGVTFEKVDMSGTDTYSYVFALATSNAGIETGPRSLDLRTQTETALIWAEAHGIISTVCECLPGDANGDGQINVGDAVYIIGYVFKGGDPPTPYNPCSGDANGDCQCNVGDAVYIISYVFKGGDPPVTCEFWRDEGGDGTGCGDY